VAISDSDRRIRYTIGFCLFALTFATYSSVAHHEFVNYDDLHLIVNNPKLIRSATLSNLLSHFYAPETGNSNWLPLYWISLQLSFALHGPDPAAFLLTNVLIHAASAVFLFAALRRLTGAVWRSAFVAAVFAVHPLHVESVAWVSERKDVLAGLFWMLGLYAYSHYTETPRSKTRYLAVMLCLILGLLSKSTLVTFPAVLLLLDVWPLDRLRGSTGRVLLEKAPMFALVAIASSVTFLAQSATGNIALGAKIGFGSRLSNAIESYWNYICDAVWPTGLAPLYPHPYALASVSNQAAIAAAGFGIALVGLTILVLMASRKRAYLGVGWLWYLGTLVPMIGLVQVGMQARADRYMYLPLVGLSIMLTWGTGELVTSNRRKLIAPLAGAALIALAIVTRLQLDHWENSIALFERAVTVTERNRYAHERLAYELLQVDRPEEARDHYRAAISIEPWHAPLYYGLAISFEDAGDSDAAIAAYRNALRRQPDMVLANGSLGLLLLQVGHLAEAKRHLLVATRAMPDSIEYKDALAAVVGELERSESGGP
jgi:tetratricopeptide (TPR) repeat protein